MTEGHPSAGALAPWRLLFVCTANMSRSPYAERRARQALAGWNVEVSSAGIPGHPGLPMDEDMARLLVARGGDAGGHVSRRVDDEVLASADLVLTFELSHHMKLLDTHPEHGGKILGVGQLAAAITKLGATDRAQRSVDTVDELGRLTLLHAGANSMSYDVDDPFRQGPKAAKACADEIDRHLDVILPFLAGASLPVLAAPGGEPAKRRFWRRG